MKTFLPPLGGENVEDVGLCETVSQGGVDVEAEDVVVVHLPELGGECDTVVWNTM